ncbi:MAG: amidohydrolase family protein [Clostridiales Family XIII bacterium]|jgi:predicted TIM-barrel fold metal-dependent hydrolase|nr:amidohydrolase family protein [Clostridiales Family XIII bacterium]
MIIDTHAHLGDVLFGKNITFKQNVTTRDHHNLLSLLEENDNVPFPGFLEMDPDTVSESILNEEQARNNTATLQNMQSSLDRNGIDKIWVLPILPTVGFEELLAASKLDERIVPFTGIDFALGEAAVDKMLRDAENGAGGLKVHPILQCRPMDDPLLLGALDAWKQTGKPVIFHTYAYEYYHPEEAYRNRPDYASNTKFVELAKQFPELTMIAAHAGGPFDFGEILEGKEVKNLYVDTSFQSEEVIRMFLREFGPERVLFGSDWPWGCQETPLRLVSKAADKDQRVLDLLFFENASRLMKGEN